MKITSNIVRDKGRRYAWVAVPSDHEHDFEPHPLGGDFTCVICHIAASDSWEWGPDPEPISGGE